MNYGCPKVDRHIKAAVKMMLRSGSWEQRPGKKHSKFVLKETGEFVVAPGSSSDPIRALKNFIADVNRTELAAGFKTLSITK